MSKISELSDGGVIQGGDTLIAVRSGGNVKVTYGGSTTANIDGGTIDGTVIGGTTAAAGTFTTGQFNTSLNVDGTAIVSDSTASVLRLLNTGTTGDGLIHFGDSASNFSGVIQYNHDADYMALFTATQERLRIDSAGNLGLGVTPSAWSAPAFQISRGSHFADTGSVGMQHNAYFNSGWKYIASSQGALQFQAIPGTGFLWNTAPSGTAGNAITFNQRMTLNASGNLGLGTTSPSARLHVNDGSFILSNSTTTDLTITGGTLNQCRIFFGDSGSSSQGRVAYDNSTDSLQVDTAGTERMRIDSSGNVGIGVVPSSWAANTLDALQLGAGIGVGNLTARVDGINAVGLGLNWYYGGGATNTYVASSYATNYVQEAGTHKWLHAASGTAGAALTFTESMRIDSSGNVGIGTSSPSRKVSLVDSVNGYNLELQQTSAYNSGNQSGIVFSAPYNIGGSVTDLASIRGGKENATNENFGGKLAFYTRANGGSDTERMRIDSSGRVTMPYQPAFNVNPLSDQNNIAINTPVTVIFNTEVFDVGSNFASNTFTAPVTGKYQLNLALRLHNIDTAADFYQIKFLTSNRSYLSTADYGGLSSNPNYWTEAFSVLADMDANDTVSITVSQSGGSVQTDIHVETTFSGYLVA
jgi:hypothetical protein